jgi:hypothetical protein
MVRSGFNLPFNKWVLGCGGKWVFLGESVRKTYGDFKNTKSTTKIVQRGIGKMPNNTKSATKFSYILEL